VNSFNDPVHVIDFRSTRNCRALEVMLPGEEIDILVRRKAPAGSPAVRARAKRSEDGDTVEVKVQTPEGEEDHNWSWSTLQDAVRVHRGRPA